MTEQEWPIAVTVVITKEEYDLNAGLAHRVQSLIDFKVDQAKFLLQDALLDEALNDDTE